LHLYFGDKTMNIRALIRRYPLTNYFLLAYAISWGGSIAVAGPKFLRGETMQLADALRMAPLVLAGPSVAGILMTYLVDGKVGLKALLSRMLKWRVGLRWYTAALLIFPVLILAVLFGLTRLVSTDFAPNLLSFGVIMGLLAGFIEEIGWTGFAYPKLHSKHGALRASLYLGLLHGVWHAVAGYLAEGQLYGVYWLPRFTVMWMVAMTAMRVILIWIYSNTGSLFLAQLTHASSTGFLVILGPSPITPANETLWWAIYALVLWVAAAAIIAQYSKRPYMRTSHST
jgi:membrane protease YdiL (CAAX protease family)